MNFNFPENPSENIDLKELFYQDNISSSNRQFFENYE